MELMLFFLLHLMNTLYHSASAVQFNTPFLLLNQSESGEIILNSHNMAQAEKLCGGFDTIKVVSIVGPYRSGKSFLLNLLSGDGDIVGGGPDRFRVESTVQPCTVGIWAKLSVLNGTLFMFLDTTGLFSPLTTEQSDARLLAIISVLSSKLIYNHFGVIDSTELSKFSFIVRYTRTLTGDLFNANQTSSDFSPDLRWVMRDFFLEIKNRNGDPISATEWMAEIMQKVAFGREIQNLFADIGAFTLPFPSLNVSQLKSLTERSSFSADFRAALSLFADDIILKTRPKSINNANLTAKTLFALIEAAADALNPDGTFSALTTANSLLSLVNARAAQRAMALFRAAVRKIELPAAHAALRRAVAAAKRSAVAAAEKGAFRSGEGAAEAAARAVRDVARFAETLSAKIEAKNREAVGEYVLALNELLAESVAEKLNTIKLPIETIEATKVAETLKADISKKFQTQAIDRFGGEGVDFEQHRKALGAAFRNLASDFEGRNLKIIEKNCFHYETTEFQNRFGDDKLWKYWNLKTFESAEKAFLTALQNQCLSHAVYLEAKEIYFRRRARIKIVGRVARVDFWRKKAIFGLFVSFCVAALVFNTGAFLKSMRWWLWAVWASFALLICLVGVSVANKKESVADYFYIIANETEMLIKTVFKLIVSVLSSTVKFVLELIIKSSRLLKSVI